MKSKVVILLVLLSVLAFSQEKNPLFPIYNFFGQYGFIDNTGKVVIEPQFDGAYYFSEGLCAVSVVQNGVISTKKVSLLLILNLMM
ncbi:MAG TPA: WG repeat-containing protein [Spirochaetota bacterium]|nr:WG repeat-containing protein [Spirochaetota bacterium]